MAISAAFSRVTPRVVTRNNGLGVEALPEAPSATTAQGGKGGKVGFVACCAQRHLAAEADDDSHAVYCGGAKVCWEGHKIP